MNENGYNYIWYPLTSFVEIPKDKIKYCISEVLSPHMELNLESINRFKKTMESTELEEIE